MTIGFDGSARRALAPFQSLGGSAGLEPDAGAPLIVGASSTPTGQLAARWKDATHVGWITFVGPTATTPARDAWELYVVEDREGATATLAMTCSGTAPQTFDFLPDGSIVAAVTEFAEGGGSSASNVVVYEANETTKVCTIARKLTANADEDVAIGDVALSPDKTTVAFFSGGRLVTAPVDGSRPPAVVPGSQEGADIGIGPRWIAGGSAITWGQSLHAGVISIPFGAGHVVWIPAAGGTQRSVVAGGAELKLQADGGAEQTLWTTYGIGQGCSAAPGLVRGSAGLDARRRPRRVAPPASQGVLKNGRCVREGRESWLLRRSSQLGAGLTQHAQQSCGPMSVRAKGGRNLISAAIALISRRMESGTSTSCSSSCVHNFSNATPGSPAATSECRSSSCSFGSQLPAFERMMVNRFSMCRRFIVHSI